MARPGFLQHRKFVRLTRLLGSKALALGSVELVWEVAYASGDPKVGSSQDVELAADWQGDPGQLVAALVEAELLDVTEGNEEIRYAVHDLFDHAPEFVADRRNKESERKKPKNCEQCGGLFQSPDQRQKYCSSACRQAAYRSRRDAGDASVMDPRDGVTERYAPSHPIPSHPSPPREALRAPARDQSAGCVTPDTRYPLTHQLIAQLEAGGWDAAMAKADDVRARVEKAIERVGVPAAVERLLGMVERERAAGGEPRPYLGWHIEAIQSAGRSGKAPLAPLPTPDVAWLAAHPGADQRWAEIVAGYKASSAGPEHLAQQLEGVLPLLYAEFDQQPGGAP